MSVNYCNFQSICIEDFDVVVVGSGFAGSVAAQQLAERAGKRVLIIEKRNHIGGNMYDEYDKAGVLIHKYGPHIFHTSNKRAFDYVCRFTPWREYQHEVLSNWYGTYMPVPFNKNSMKIAFGEEKATFLIDKLVKQFGDERKVTINELRAVNDPDLAEVADFVYKNVFLYYTQKQWGVTPEEVDPSVTARVPVFLSHDNRYFQDTYQGLPAKGYTPLFENMLSHPNITVCLNTEAESVFDLKFASDEELAPVSEISIKGLPFNGEIIYTGPLDELFLQRFGRLPYRTLNFVYETYSANQLAKLHKDDAQPSNAAMFQPCATVNYTVTEDFTRITEFKYLTGQTCSNTTIMKEYSQSYEDPRTQIPYYAIINPTNNEHYTKYARLVENMPNFHCLGRLAEYRYYNMDNIIVKALELCDSLCAR